LHPVDGWVDFATDTYNNIYSAPGEEGICPSPESPLYELLAPETTGHWCLMLMIQDGGLNDADGEPNGTIVDPGGLSVLKAAPTVSISSIGSITEGGTISLSGNVATNGNNITYEWQKTAGPTVTINNANQLNASVSNAPAGSYTFQLTITDQLDRTASATVSVTVRAAPSTGGGGGGGGGGGSMGIIMVIIVASGFVRRYRRQ